MNHPHKVTLGGIREFYDPDDHSDEEGYEARLERLIDAGDRLRDERKDREMEDAWDKSEGRDA